MTALIRLANHMDLRDSIGNDGAEWGLYYAVLRSQPWRLHMAVLFRVSYLYHSPPPTPSHVLSSYGAFIIPSISASPTGSDPANGWGPTPREKREVTAGVERVWEGG